MLDVTGEASGPKLFPSWELVCSFYCTGWKSFLDANCWVLSWIPSSVLRTEMPIESWTFWQIPPVLLPIIQVGPFLVIIRKVEASTSRLIQSYLHDKPDMFTIWKPQYKATEWLSGQTLSWNYVPDAPAGWKDSKVPIRVQLLPSTKRWVWLCGWRRWCLITRNHSYFHVVWGVTVSLSPVLHSNKCLPVFVSGVLMLHNPAVKFHNVVTVHFLTCPPELPKVVSWWVLREVRRLWQSIQADSL